MPRHSSERALAELQERLRARRAEIEEAIFTRACALLVAPHCLDPEYLRGLRCAVDAAIECGLDSICRAEERSLSVPPATLCQARLAARAEVSLDSVLRRYVAGRALFLGFLLEEADRLGMSPLALLPAQNASFDRFLAAIGKEYERERSARARSPEQQLTKRIERLLAGEAIDQAELAYDLQAHHLAAVAKGPLAAEAIRALTEPLDCRLMLLPRPEGVLWAWIGARSPLDPAELSFSRAHERIALSLGEPGQGIGGWRRSHLQARAALPIALGSAQGFARYGHSALLASALGDELLASSLRALYLEPLQRGRDRGEQARETLRAYLASECNASSAAALLGVSRQTVTRRLRSIELRLGRPLSECAAELQVALRLEEWSGGVGLGV